jgi:low affinity Fe/Cu permease
LRNVHNRDIHALNARLDEFIAEMRDHRQDAGGLSEDELLQIRELLKRQRQDGEEDVPVKNSRDRRPSLF